MEFVREQDKQHKGYKYYMDIEDQMNKEDVKVYVSRLTSEQKAELDKYRAVLRQRKFSSKGNNKEIYNARRNEHIIHLRTVKPEEMAEQNRKDVKNHRERNKAKEEEILNKLKENETKLVLPYNLRARKTPTQPNEESESQMIVNDVLNSIIETIPEKSRLKKNNETVKRHKAKKEAGEPIRAYNTRSRAKK